MTGNLAITIVGQKSIIRIVIVVILLIIGNQG